MTRLRGARATGREVGDERDTGITRGATPKQREGLGETPRPHRASPGEGLPVRRSRARQQGSPGGAVRVGQPPGAQRKAEGGRQCRCRDGC